jgi:hypothetical protein
MIGMIIGTASEGARQNICHGKSFGLAPVPTPSAAGVLAFIPVAVFAAIKLAAATAKFTNCILSVTLSSTLI